MSYRALDLGTLKSGQCRSRWPESQGTLLGDLVFNNVRKGRCGSRAVVAPLLCLVKAVVCFFFVTILLGYSMLKNITLALPPHQVS